MANQQSTINWFVRAIDRYGFPLIAIVVVCLAVWGATTTIYKDFSTEAKAFISDHREQMKAERLRSDKLVEVQERQNDILSGLATEETINQILQAQEIIVTEQRSTSNKLGEMVIQQKQTTEAVKSLEQAVDQNDGM